MTRYTEYGQLNLPEIDRQIAEFWEQNGIFEKSVEQRDVKKPFVFYEGPPSANGLPGIHHVMARTVKDLFCRFRTMQGYRVERKAGWDTHGLPIELQVEKELGISKDDIGTKISVDEYNAACRKTVMRYTDIWNDVTKRMGYWVDLDDPYVTFENDYIESVWHQISLLHKQGYLYQGYTVQPYSPAAGTGLSTHELNQPGCYRDVKDTSAVAQFVVTRNEASEQLFDAADEDVRFIAWTTTPWTLPSNTALAVGKKITYVKVKTFNPYTHKRVSVILAEDLLSKWFKADLEGGDFAAFEGEPSKKIPWERVKTFSGQELDGIRYEQLLPYAQPEEGDAFRVVIGDFVSTEDGTGIVHLAPSFGADDMRVCKENGIGALTLVDLQGRFVDAVTDFAGRYVKNYADEADYKNVDVDISIKLKTENKAFDVRKYSHNYPHCWRTDKPVLYYPLDSWFIESTRSSKRMVELNEQINWKPASTGEKRFKNWLENLKDWNLSRMRFWGVPLPLWQTDDREQTICIGSVEQLKAEIEKANAALGLNQDVPADLHRPYIDDVILVSEDGREMRRDPDVADVWFDSGSMPYAQWHAPFENEEKFKRNFPADFIAEGVDQTRGWFFTLHAIATMNHDSIAYKNVISNGLVLDKNGVKMSKRLGNGIDPFEMFDQHGADATRWYMISNAPPWDNLKFDPDGVMQVRRKFFGTLHSTYSFFALYANIDGFHTGEAIIPVADRPEIDRWVLSKLNSLIKVVTAEYENYDATKAARAIQQFTDIELSNWFVRLSRRRFWKGEYGTDKKAAYQTLFTCLEAIARMMAPISPFYADQLYRDLHSSSQAKESVHLAAFPIADEVLIDLDLEKRMSYAQRLSSMVLSLRKQENLRVRQPLARIMVPVLDPQIREHIDLVKDLILSEVNVKQLEYLDDASGVLNKEIKANFKTLGRRFGKQMKAAAGQIAAMTAEDIAELESKNSFALQLDSGEEQITLDDVIITTQDIPGWLAATDAELSVALDITLTDDLKAEGYAREIINRVQNLRKDSGLDVTDTIHLSIEQHEALQAAITTFGDYIKLETLADSLSTPSELKDGTEIELPDDITLHIALKKA